MNDADKDSLINKIPQVTFDSDEEEQESKTTVKAVVEPLERGYGHTLGTGMRRMLLSSIPGASIVDVRIEGVEHEYCTIEGAREDVVNILLNLREVAFEMLEGNEGEANLKIEGKKVITAADFKTTVNLRVANPDMHIATLVDDSAKLTLNARVCLGHGYRPSEDADRSSLAVGSMVLDAVFNPIRRVAYRVDKTRLGERTDLDRLILEVETDGSVDAREAVGRAASLLRRQLLPLAALAGDEALDLEIEADFDPFLSELVGCEELGLSSRIANNLVREKLVYIGDLVQVTETELLKTPNFGKRSIDEIKECLEQRGLHLAMEIEGWTSPSDGDAAGS